MTMFTENLEEPTFQRAKRTVSLAFGASVLCEFIGNPWEINVPAPVATPLVKLKSEVAKSKA